jgi:VWFA-related protein
VSSTRLVKTLLLIALLAAPIPLETRGQPAGDQEITTTNIPFTLKVQRNEVPVRVIVRDADGRPVRNLTKGDFQIFDDGKPQVITQFSAEREAPASVPSAPKPENEAGAPTAAPAIADRFVALYFDDLVMKFEDLPRIRDAATKYLQTALQATDRVGIFTSSEKGNVDFTADRDKLQQALLRLNPVGRFARSGLDCPDLSDYEAYLIDEAHDPSALEVATQKVINCQCRGDAQDCPNAEQRALMAARERWTEAQEQERATLRGLGELVRRLSVMPGQRAIVFVSRGFLSERQTEMISETIDRAVRAGVVVNSLDARGLYTLIPGGDASEPGSGLSGALEGRMIQMQTAAAQADADVMAEMADGTGGVFFQNNNDMNAGFRSAGGLAEFSYVLVFSPSELKANGKYHHLKVTLTGAGASNFKVQARRGYFAPGAAQNAAKAEEREIADAVFSRDELNSSRLRIGTRFFKSSASEARLTIIARLDTQGLTFRTESGRHADDVTFVTVLFDMDGKYVGGVRKSVAMHLLDRTLERLRTTGFSMASDFKIAPGNYLVREVVRDEGGVISSRNDEVQIPY